MEKENVKFCDCKLFQDSKQINSEPISDPLISDDTEYHYDEDFSFSFNFEDKSGLLYIYALWGNEIKKTIHRMGNEWKGLFYKTIRQN